ncbi:MAG: DUF1297 domain-containing protein [Candidatus Aenigmatarchaeota archaeon]
MIKQKDIREILKGYDKKNITIGVLGDHSGLQACHGAKTCGFRTVAVCQKGREKIYSKYYRSRGRKGVVDDIILLDNLGEITKEEVQEELRRMNTILVHNKYFWFYCDFKGIEENFRVPIFGSRSLLRLEERETPKNQYYLLKKAGIRFPKLFRNPRDIDRLVLVKAHEACRGHERAFFFANCYEEYLRKSEMMLKKGQITHKSLENAVIEEYVLGTQINFNYFYSPINREVEFMGTDTRRLTNLDALLSLPVTEQLETMRQVTPKMIETGHIPCTTRESMLERAFEIGEAFVEATRTEYPPGIIGPFALQGCIVPGPPIEDIVVFDVSLRIPGNPGIRFSPHSSYLHARPIS